jgi:hypothetical protein
MTKNLANSVGDENRMIVMRGIDLVKHDFGVGSVLDGFDRDAHFLPDGLRYSDR